MIKIQIFKLWGSILVNSSDADKSIAKTDKKAGGLGTTLGKGIKTAAKFGAALGAGALVAGGAIFALGVKLGNAADELLDLNSITGMSTDNIQKWRKATEVAGVATDAMTNASKKLTKSLDTMGEGSNKGNEALVKLGLSLEGIESMSADERMNTLTEALAGVDDKTARARIGTDLFGGTWAEIAPVVDLGTEAMNRAKDSANIISEEDLKKANDFRIKVADMKDQLSFFVTEITIAVMPTLSKMMDWVQDKMPVIQSTTKRAFDVAGTAIENVSNFVEDNIIPIFSALFKLIMDNKDKIEIVLSGALNILKTAFDAVKKAVKLVIDNMNILLPIIIGVTAAVGAQMIINALVTAYKTWQTATKTQTTLQWLLNTALTANPLGLVAIAVGVLVAAIYLLYENFEAVTGAIKTAWEWLTKWNDKDAKDKNVNVKTNYTSSGGGMTGGVPRYASGTDYHPGGMAIVGEKGAELINLPRGSSVKTADETASMMGGVNISFEGANFSVRNDNDIKTLAKELGDYINSAGRRRGYA